MTDCMCRGCYAGPGASLHYIPKDPDIRQKWIDFIYKNRTAPKFKNLDRIRICSAHFTEDCFTNYRQKMMGFGKRLILKPNAVPTVAAQLEITAPSRTRREKVDETTTETCLCPLCQRRQKDIEALSLHLIKKHSVHPACLDNLLVTAPCASHSRDAATESRVHSLNGTPQQTTSENTKCSLLPAQQDGSSQGIDARDELGVGYTEINSDTEVSVSDKKSNARSNGAADGNIKCPFKCYACLEFLNQKSASSVPYNSATIFQKNRAGTGNDKNSSTPILTQPYVSSKPYQCDVCHVSFFYSFGLESHRKSVLHQSRSRKAESTASNYKTNTQPGITVANLRGMTVANSATKLTFGKACNCNTKAEKVQLQPASSLLPNPGASTQSAPSVLPLLTLCPNSVPHAIIPPDFPPPGTSSAQLMPQTQMLMPLIVNGLHTQSPSPDGPQQVLQQAVPVLHLCSAQHPQAPRTSDAQTRSSASGDSSTFTKHLERNTTIDGVEVKLKTEIKEEPCDEPREATLCVDAISQLDSKEYNSVRGKIKDNNKMCDSKQNSKAKCMSVGGSSKRQHSEVNKALSKDIQSSNITKCSLTKCGSSHANLVLMPSCTNPCSSLCGPPILTEFQSQVLWAFFESRNEADSEIPPREDCEALGRVVGLTEDEVQKWLVDTHRNKYKHRGNVQSYCKRQGSTEDDEDTLVIDESGGMVLRSATDFLSEEEDVDNEQTTVDKKRKRGKDEDESEELGATKCRFLPSYRTS